MTWLKHSWYFPFIWLPGVLLTWSTNTWPDQRSSLFFRSGTPWLRERWSRGSLIHLLFKRKICCISNWVYTSVWRAYSAMNKQESSSCRKAYSYTEDPLLKTQGPERFSPFFFRLAYGRLFKHHLNLNWLLISHSVNIRGATVILRHVSDIIFSQLCLLEP